MTGNDLDNQPHCSVRQARLSEETTGVWQIIEMDPALRWRGGIDRRRLVEESSDDPWSAAERRLHRMLRMLRKAGLTNWRGNWPSGDYTIDVAFAEHRLAVEVDGKQFHGDANFEKDRWRQNALVLDGWRVLRFTWTMIQKYPDRVIETVRRGLAPAGDRR